MHSAYHICSPQLEYFISVSPLSEKSLEHQPQYPTESIWAKHQRPPPFWQFLSPFINWANWQLGSFLENFTLFTERDRLIASILRGIAERLLEIATRTLVFELQKSKKAR